MYVCSDTHKGRVDPKLGHAKPRVDEKRKRHSEALCKSWRRVKTTTHVYRRKSSMNNIKMNVVGTQVVCTVMLNGQMFGQVMPSREEALAFYYKEASHLDSLGVLHPESGIIN